MFELTDKAIVTSPGADPAAGALVVFTGIVRDHNDGRTVVRLEYEAMESVAVKEGERIIEEARARFSVSDLRCVHRVGDLRIGDEAVVVWATASHRRAAFDACQWVIDEVKSRVPIWKREHYADGTVEWVNAAEKGRAEGPAILIDSVEGLMDWSIIDVRDEDEISEDPVLFEHLRSPAESFDRTLLGSGKVLLVCASGIRALILADDLRREGHPEVWSLTGGCRTLSQIARRAGRASQTP